MIAASQYQRLRASERADRHREIFSMPNGGIIEAFIMPLQASNHFSEGSGLPPYPRWLREDVRMQCRLDKRGDGASAANKCRLVGR